jgi:hypothetical protein
MSEAFLAVILTEDCAAASGHASPMLAIAAATALKQAALRKIWGRNTVVPLAKFERSQASDIDCVQRAQSLD